MSRMGSLILVLILMSSLFMVLLPIHSVAAESVRVYVDPPVVVDPPTFFNVSVKVENVQDLMGIQLRLNWNPSLLYGVNMTDVIFHETVPQSAWNNIWVLENEIDNTLGRASYAYTYFNGIRAVQAGYAPISGNFTIFVLMFQVRSVGNCTLHFDTSKLGDSQPISMPIVHDTIDGFFSNSLLPPPIPPPPSPEPQVSFHIDPRAVKNESLTINSTFSVIIKLDSIADHSGFASYGIILSWNTTLLEFVDMTEVMFHEVVAPTEWTNINEWTRVTFSDTTGTLGFGLTLPHGYGPVFGNHTAAMVTFHVINVGKCPLLLDDCRAINMQAAPLISTWKSGYFSNAMSGDTNGDGRVDLYDALLLAKSFGSHRDLQSWNEDADINGDGFIDIYDVLLLCRSFGRMA